MIDLALRRAKAWYQQVRRASARIPAHEGDRNPSRVYNSDASVRLSESRYLYPDVSVSCDDCDQPTTEQTQVLAPRVIVEVLSDSTEGKDRIKRAYLYHPYPTIQEYVLISTRYQAVEVQRRTDDEWTIHVFGPDDEIELASIDVRFPLAALYRGTAVVEMVNSGEE